nr:hypothetical protein [Tanacetum cinerariifolium]GEZ56143.1 hypothetical protein [Tanacetum cinerariifolium]
MDSNEHVRVKEEKEDEVDPTKGSSYINLKVVSNLNEFDPYFRVRRDAPLLRVMMTWGVRAKVDYNTVRFTHDGKRIHALNTPNDFDMEDDDCIDAWTEQLDLNWKSLNSKGDQTDKISNSVFVTNFPDHVRARDL